MNILDAPLLVLLAPRVLHELPGRLRIHMPILRKISAQYGVIVDTVAVVLGERPGIHEILPCLTTGNIVVKYDPERFTREDIMGYMRAVTRLFVNNRRRINSISNSDPAAVAERVGSWLRDQLDRGHAPGADSKVPDDILA